MGRKLRNEKTGNPENNINTNQRNITVLHPASIIVLAVVVLAPFSFAHLDAGFDQTTGPYQIDVGWTPAAPAAGESVLIAVNVLDAARKLPANVSYVWLRLDLKDHVYFAGTLALSKGSTSLTYVFPKAGVWTVTVQAENHKAQGELWVPGQTATSETGAWLLATVFGIATAVLGFLLWTKRR